MLEPISLAFFEKNRFNNFFSDLPTLKAIVQVFAVLTIRHSHIKTENFVENLISLALNILLLV
jgi:hypothetical protein